MARPHRQAYTAKPMGDLRLWLKAVGRQWVSIVMGSAVSALIGILERLTGLTVGAWYYAVIVFCLFVFYACYQAWRVEHQALEAERAKSARPDLDPWIDAVYITPALTPLEQADHPDSMFLTVRVCLANQNTVQTTLKGLKIAINDTVQTRPFLDALNYRTLYRRVNGQVIERLQCLTDVICPPFVAAQGIVQCGWIRHPITSASREQLLGAKIDISIHDAFGIEHIATVKGPWSTPGEIFDSA